LGRLAKSLDEQNKPEAAAAYDNYLEVEPSDEAVRSRRLHSLLAQEKYDDALAELDRRKPRTALRSTACASVRTSKSPKKMGRAAITTIQKALALAPNDAPICMAAWDAGLMQRPGVSVAEKELKTALTLDHSNLVYLKDLSSTYYLGGNYAAALATMTRLPSGKTLRIYMVHSRSLLR